jgi:putative hydrolase of the HAD superfamily
MGSRGVNASPRFVFDFGAVLFRWRPSVVVAAAWPEQAEQPAWIERAVRDCFQGYGGDWGLFDQGLIDVDTLARRHEARLGWPPERVHAVVAAAQQELQPQAGVLALMEALQAAGHRLSYLSNMPAPLARALQLAHPLRDWFESGVFSSDVRLCKPDPALFGLAARRFGEDPGDCLLIDDHPANVAGAQAAGWRAIAFTDAPALAVALRAGGWLPQPKNGS